MEIRRWLLQFLALLTMTTALLLNPSASTSSSISTVDDLPTLLSFKSLITKDPLGALSSWTINSSSNGSHGFCSWTGVKCSRTHLGSVMAPRLQGLSLSGTVSPFLGNLSRLRVLDLSNNKLEGTIPSDIGKLSNLKALSLSQNRCHGEIPSSIGNISQLSLLTLSANNLEGSIPATFGNLTELISLDLSLNLLSGQIPEVLNPSKRNEFWCESTRDLRGDLREEFTIQRTGATS
ncbi:receptor kinase-like protein Xa21 [Triticum dicoccoides]|uniref:receptor kinase-like protein Xa21 n=1 Tax=Triticum dicoccoides TaxID=85692 RepID=UPI00188DD1E2|nr:receptor kinase-like protein Xa21 [Triticum dicoccoides]